MKKIPIGLVIKDLIKQKDIDVTQLAKELGIARNTVYQVFGRSKLSEDDLKKWANVLGVSVNEITQSQIIQHNVITEEIPTTNPNQYNKS